VVHVFVSACSGQLHHCEDLQRSSGCCSAALLLCCIGGPGGYGAGISRKVFHSDCAAASSSGFSGRPGACGSPEERGGYAGYAVAVPILVTLLDRLRGPGGLWARSASVSAGPPADLTEALGDPGDQRVVRCRQDKRDQLRGQRRNEEEQ